MIFKNNIFGITGFTIGTIAFLIMLLHYSAGPINPENNLDNYIAGKAVSIKEKTIAALKGEDYLLVGENKNRFDADRIVSIITTLFSGIAIIFGIIAFIKRESQRKVFGLLQYAFMLLFFNLLIAFF